MNRLALASSLLMIFAAAHATASDIPQLDLAALEPKSELIVVGVVAEVTARDSWSDTVSVRCVSALKGKCDAKTFSLRLRNKGVKDFDPVLRAGDRCVFFLGSLRDGNAELAYWGSVAVMPKGVNFSGGEK